MTSRSEKTIIAIDPGASGGLAILTQGKAVVCLKMPSTPGDLLDTLRSLAERSPGIECVIEQVGTYMPGNSGPAAATFARHMGHLDMALLAAGIPSTLVTPAKWQRGIGIPPKLEKAARKNAIKAAMQRRHPNVKVTLWNADALGILEWWMNSQRAEGMAA